MPFDSDYVAELQPTDPSLTHVVELGVRQQVGDRAIVSFGVGPGLTRQSPRVRAQGVSKKRATDG
jgi:hypothetical protein